MFEVHNERVGSVMQSEIFFENLHSDQSRYCLKLVPKESLCISLTDRNVEN